VTLTKLSVETLGDISADVEKPSYQQNELMPGIVHVGIGNFHRAHQATYLHRLFDMGFDRDWAIIGAGVTQYDCAMRQRLVAQDWLTTVVELDPEKLSARIIGSMIEFAEVNPDSVVDAMVQPAIRIVSLTVTEGGYFVDAQTGGFDASHPDIVADANNPEHPKTVFGIIIAALNKRRQNGTKPFTVMSCDNLPENGRIARRCVLGLAKTVSDELHDWISVNVKFPSSMVDCITPRTGETEFSLLKDTFGIDDNAPVVCEPFHQWVLEDTFSNGRPALEKVGVEFVADVAPYELMKLRILNAGHASIAYLAGLLDIHYVHEAMAHPLVASYLDKLERTEIFPTLEKIPGVSYETYFNKIVERFSNEAVADTIPRLCFDGTSRQPQFVLPIVDARLKKNQSIDGLSLECALWCRYCFGTTDSGADIGANDPQWDRLSAQAALAKSNPQKWLQLGDVYGVLATDPQFVSAFSQALTSLWKNGTSATVQHYLTSGVHEGNVV